MKVYKGIRCRAFKVVKVQFFLRSEYVRVLLFGSPFVVIQSSSVVGRSQSNISLGKLHRF